MRCGVPVITSNASSIPEVVGNGAIMVDPDRPDEIFAAMKEILLDKDLRIRIGENGLKQSIRFNWKTSARELFEMFEGISKSCN
jgi:glycosyltransferase involved in cell wall biosynthesis